MKFLVTLILIGSVALGGAYVVAGRMTGPAVEIGKPDKFVGLASPFEVVASAPNVTFGRLQVVFEQNGKQTPLFSLEDPGKAVMKQEPPETVRITGELGKQTVPDLQSGPARLIVTASRPVLYGIRTVETTAVRDLQVRLERPRVSVISTHHYVNLGGAEMVIYRVSPDDVQSGVVVGDVEYPGFPASGVTVEGIRLGDPAVRVAFFALLYDQDINTPIRVFARDEAGNSARADFDHRKFPKPFKKSRINLDDRFLDRVVPAILEGTTDIQPQGETLDKFLAINGELRRKNAEKIASFAGQTAPEMLWRGVVFHPFTNTAVESAFADHRTYLYRGKEVDQQVHLGFDLASLAGAPILGANRGKVVFADELGIYGNCVIVDHGMGLQSLYAHLSSIEVEAGQMVEKEQTLGRSGMTGLAGGDHLHFTMLLHGRMINPVEWWDAHWIEDRILRKLRAAGSGS
ncbi:MAG TPA: M23 family metallopeptidase [Vicinamibacterales bacterium]|nr:M23 family metallopeptidase [Vicinamibacterales bacterium]